MEELKSQSPYIKKTFSMLPEEKRKEEGKKKIPLNLSFFPPPT